MASPLSQDSRRITHSLEYVFPSCPQTGKANRAHGKSQYSEKYLKREDERLSNLHNCFCLFGFFLSVN